MPNGYGGPYLSEYEELRHRYRSLREAVLTYLDLLYESFEESEDAPWPAELADLTKWHEPMRERE